MADSSNTPKPWEGLNPPYRTIVADPPWHYDDYATGPRSPGVWQERASKPLPYSTMSVSALAELPVRDLAMPDAWLFLWTTNKYLPDAFTIAEWWEFEYRQLIVWHKTGDPSPFGGSVAPNHAEYLLVCKSGTPETLDRLPSSVIAAQRPRIHSKKPATFLDAVEHIAPGPYVELFARAPRLGWDSWGYGYETAAS